MRITDKRSAVAQLVSSKEADTESISGGFEKGEGSRPAGPGGQTMDKLETTNSLSSLLVETFDESCFPASDKRCVIRRCLEELYSSLLSSPRTQENPLIREE